MKGLTGRATTRALLISGISAMGLLSQPAMAQANADDDNDNTIIVTAQFREQALQDTPLAITAIDAASLQAKNQTNITQVADRAPNVSLRPQGAAFGPSVSASIRGVGQTDFNPAFEPGVGMYVDDVYFPQLTGAAFDLLDLERVEILRGPQGTLAGRNSIGGAVKLYSKKPEGSNTGFVEATYGSRNKIGMRASADFALTDNLSGRISGVYKSQDGYVDVLDFGCVNPPGAGTTFVDNNGDTQEINPIDGIQPLATSSNCKIDEMGDVNYQAVRGVLRWESPDGALDITVSGDYTRDRRGNAAEVLAATSIIDSVNTNNNGIPLDDRFVCGTHCNYATFFAPDAVGQYLFAPDAPLGAYIGNNQTTYDGWNVSNNIDWEVSDMISIQNILAYGEFDSTFDTDGDLAPTFTGVGNNDLSHWHWSEELRINIQPVESVVLTLGGYYFDQETTYFSYQDIRYVPVFPLLFQQPDVTEADSKAVFANLGWEIVPDLNLSAGIRYTKESKVYNYFRLNRDGTVNPFLDGIGAVYGIGYSGADTLDANGNGDVTEIVSALSGNAAVYTGSNVDYRVALDYRFSEELLVYASIATGFKGGGTNPRPFNAFQAVGFGPEDLTSYELGFKSDLLDRRLRLNVTGFISDYTNIQLGVSECPLLPGAPPSAATPCAGRINGGDARFKGIEIEMFAEPADGFNIDASLSAISAKYTRLLPTAEFSPTNLGGIERDDPLSGGAPEFKWNIGAQYEIDLGSGGTLTPRVDVEHTGKIYTGSTRLNDPTVRDPQFLPKETLVNARLTWMNEDEDLSISLEGRNLTNEYYYYTQFDLRTAGAGSLKAAVAPPREIAVTVRKNF